MAHDHTQDEIRSKKASQGTRPGTMIWVLIISTLAAALALYLILAVGWTGPVPWGN